MTNLVKETRGRPPKYPFRAMAVYDELLIPLNDGETPRQGQRRISGTLGWQTKRHGLRFTTRIVDGGVLVTRTPSFIGVANKTPDNDGLKRYLD